MGAFKRIVLAKLNRIELRQERILKALAHLTKESVAMNQATQDALNALTAKVEDESTVEAGLSAVIDHAVDTINSIPSMISDALTKAGSGTDTALVDALNAISAKVSDGAAALAAKKDELSAAVVANTPAAPTE